MHLRSHLYSLLLLATCLLLPTSCITEDAYDHSRRGTFEALWHTLDEHYCFFDYKQQEYGLDWQPRVRHLQPHHRRTDDFAPALRVLSRMTYELRDGHVNLYAAHDVARYGDWFDRYPMNQSDSLERRYLGLSHEYESAAGIEVPHTR